MGLTQLWQTEHLRNDPLLDEACQRVYNFIVKADKPVVESQLARELTCPQLLGMNSNLHGSYLRTALDLLVSHNALKKKGAEYSKR